MQLDVDCTAVATAELKSQQDRRRRADQADWNWVADGVPPELVNTFATAFAIAGTSMVALVGWLSSHLGWFWKPAST